MSLKQVTQNLVEQFRSRPTIRAGSLIVTVFGDAIAPRGGTVWIGSLIRVLDDFGISERLVRTSVFRLVRDDWLEVDQVGRRSYYSLSNSGARQFEQATLRIYGDPRQSWEGDWCLVLLAGLDGEQKEAIRRELGWIGFGAISSNVLAHPTPDLAEMDATLKRAGIDRQVVVMRGSTLGKKQDDAMRALVRTSWNLDEIDQRYADFVEQFRPPVGRQVIEIPAGLVGDDDSHPEETIADTARRELLEETGFEARQWTNLGSFHVDPNRGAGVCHLFLATEAERVGQPDSDDVEDQQLLFLSRSEISVALDDGRFKALSWTTAVSLALRHVV